MIPRNTFSTAAAAIVNSRRQQIMYSRHDHRTYDAYAPTVVQHRTGQPRSRTMCGSSSVSTTRSSPCTIHH